MKLCINNELKLCDLQDQFHKHFPNLKLEFYSEPHYAGGGTASRYLLKPDSKLGLCRKNKNEGEISITKRTRVFELEHEFRSKYELNAQVFRKSGDTWFETVTTDYWTLAEHEKEGIRVFKLQA